MPVPSPARPSARTHRFDEVPVPRIPRSVFDMPSNHKGTMSAGFLYPVYVHEILPGDTVVMDANFFGRLQTLDFPILDNLYLDTFWFYCPNRLLWNNWAKFLGAQDDPADSIDFSIPTIEGGGDPGEFVVGEGSLHDHFGLPIATMDASTNVNALPSRMYNLVWNEWFRDQNLQDSVVVDRDDGPDNRDDYGILQRGKRHDYITSCLPWPQKGDAVSLPIGSSAPVIGNGTTIGLRNGTDLVGLYSAVDDDHLFIGTDVYGDPVGTVPTQTDEPTALKSLGLATTAANSGMIADLSSAVAATINDMRVAIATQQILERDARMGTRYVERIFGQFGVVVPDFTAQRPEYLGGSIEKVGMFQVPQMTPSPGTPTQLDSRGGLGAYAQVTGHSGFTRSFVEHGYIMGIVNLRADINWQQRLDKMWTRQTRYDFYDPLFAHLGEQAVLNQEVFYVPEPTGTPAEVFGYQERFAEYRSKLNTITGKFRSVATSSLENWHLAVELSAEPDLNAAFIVDSPPMSRILAVENQPHLMLDCFFRARYVRPIPVYGIPGLGRL